MPGRRQRSWPIRWRECIAVRCWRQDRSPLCDTRLASCTASWSASARLRRQSPTFVCSCCVLVQTTPTSSSANDTISFYVLTRLSWPTRFQHCLCQNNGLRDMVAPVVTRCRRAAATICPRPSPPSVGTKAPRATEPTAQAECRPKRSSRFPRPIRSYAHWCSCPTR